MPSHRLLLGNEGAEPHLIFPPRCLGYMRNTKEAPVREKERERRKRKKKEKSFMENKRRNNGENED